jgi:hypothetical protein
MVQFGNAPTFEDRGYLHADGKKIYHEYIHGDDTTFPFVYDWDGDGKLDILMGDGDGYVTFYRNIGTKTAPKFEAGAKLNFTDGTPLCVGVPTPKTASDFEGHSGNRSVPAPGDYDGDGKIDLICPNAAGDVFFYRNAGDGRFLPGVKIATGTNRGWAFPVDWDRDGKMDVVLSWSSGTYQIHLNRGMAPNGAPKFDRVEIKDVPWMPHPRPIVIDWDRDGDDDIVWAASYSVLHFASRDFMQTGYLKARLASLTLMRRDK